MSIIAAGTTTTTALSSTGNTDGTLQFQVNGTTPSVTLNTLGAVGVGSSPSYGTSGQVLISGGSTTAPTWGTAGAATTATNLAGGSNGTIPYQSASGTTQMLAAGTSGQLLQSNGAAAPSWVAAPSTSPAGSTGQVQYNNAGAFGALSSGTSGQVLTSGGSGAAPTWSDPAGGGSLILVQSVNGTSVDTVDLTGNFSSTYDFYKIYVSMNGSSTTTCYMRMYINSVLQTSNYSYSTLAASPGAQLGTGNYNSSVGYVETGMSGYVVNLEITVFQPSNTNNRCEMWYTGAASGSTGTPNPSSMGKMSWVGSASAGARALTGMRFTTFGDAVNWTVRLYGIKKT